MEEKRALLTTLSSHACLFVFFSTAHTPHNHHPDSQNDARVCPGNHLHGRPGIRLGVRGHGHERERGQRCRLCDGLQQLDLCAQGPPPGAGAKPRNLDHRERVRRRQWGWQDDRVLRRRRVGRGELGLGGGRKKEKRGGRARAPTLSFTSYLSPHYTSRSPAAPAAPPPPARTPSPGPPAAPAAPLSPSSPGAPDPKPMPPPRPRSQSAPTRF